MSAPGEGDDIGIDVAVAAEGRVFIAGTVASLHKGTEVALARFSTTGTLAWMRVWDGGVGKDDVAHVLAVSKAGVVVAGAATPAAGEARGVVLKARLSMTRSARLRARRSALPGLDLSWASVAINAAGDVAVAGEAAGGGRSEFALAKWPGDGSAATFAHSAPLNGAASGARVWRSAGGTVVVAGRFASGSTRGINVRSIGPAPHAWAHSTSDDGVCTGLVASADGVCVAGPVGAAGFPAQTGLWMDEP